MPNYRRNFLAGGTFFFTVVTDGRRPILAGDAAVGLLRDAVRVTRRNHPFGVVASVILPDHLHMIWTLPPGDARFDRRWSSIKQGFTRAWLAADGEEHPVTPGRFRDRRRGVWQPRYLEHTLRDEDDLARHVDYIHYNPVKHGCVTRPIDWPYSSLHRYVAKGWLPATWGVGPGGAERYRQDIDEGLLEA